MQPLALGDDDRDRRQLERRTPGHGGLSPHGDAAEADDLGEQHVQRVAACSILGGGDHVDDLIGQVEAEVMDRGGAIGGIGVGVELPGVELVVPGITQAAGTVLGDGEGTGGGADLELSTFLPDAAEVDDECSHCEETHQHHDDEHHRRTRFRTNRDREVPRQRPQPPHLITPSVTMVMMLSPTKGMRRWKG